MTTTSKNDARTHQTDMTRGKPIRLILRFSLPLLFGNLFQQLYNTVDSVIVGNFVGKHALAAVGVGFPFMFALVSFFLGIGMATTILISQSYGAHDTDRVRLIAGTIYRVLSLSILPLMLLGFFLARPVLTLMNVPNDGTLDMAVSYLQIIFLGIFGMIGYNLNAGLLQGVGDSVTSVRFLILAAVTNIVLDLIFVIPLGMGVAGAALATSISEILSWILGLIYINRHYTFFRIRLLHLPFDRVIFREALRLGIPSAIQNTVFSFGIIAMNSLINTFGTDFIAGFNGANKIDTFIFMPIQSFANAVTTYTGQNVGAANLERIHEGRRAGMIVSIAGTIVTGLLLYPLSGYAIALFNSDPGVVEVGVWYLHSVLPAYPLLAILFVQNSILRGVGKAMAAMITSLIALWFARVPAAYWIAATFGKQYIFLSYAIGWAIGCIVSYYFYHRGSWHDTVRAGGTLNQYKSADE
ncbi:MAG: MATE family efflux transporter [Ndongobacter sp.]|nr:MATE family efflux transporter [Ndongobacter sp.]